MKVDKLYENNSYSKTYKQKQKSIMDPQLINLLKEHENVSKDFETLNVEKSSAFYQWDDTEIFPDLDWDAVNELIRTSDTECQTTAVISKDASTQTKPMTPVKTPPTNRISKKVARSLQSSFQEALTRILDIPQSPQ